jgi:hypothetical protein
MLLLSALMIVTAAHAASGQFEGVYVREGLPVVTPSQREALELKCVLAPVVIGADGIGTGYFLDTELFQSNGTVSFSKGQEFDCRYNPQSKLETCQSREFSDGKSLHYYRSNVYQVFTPDLQQGHSLLTPEDVANWKVSGTLNPDNRFAYHRCKCLKANMVVERASNIANELSGEETALRLYWGDNEPSSQDTDTAREVIEKIIGCNAQEAS